MIFSKRVRSFRFANDLNQVEMAELLGCTSNYIHLLETEKKTPSETLEKLFESLARSPKYRPIPEDVGRALAIGQGSGQSITGQTAEQKVQAATEFILENGEHAVVSAFLGMVEATRRAVADHPRRE